jgi:NADH-quinone oxidoreductase subunit J
MILFLFTIMLMNLNKENEVHKPRITRLGAVVSLLDNCCFNFHQLKPIIGEYISREDYQSNKSIKTYKDTTTSCHGGRANRLNTEI